MTSKTNILAIDLAENSFQVYTVGRAGFNSAVSRTRLATRQVFGAARAGGGLDFFFNKTRAYMVSLKSVTTG